MFRSVRFFRLSSAWPESDQALSQLLSSAEFKPCSAWSEASSGWESPAGDADPSLSRRVDGADLLRLRTQARLLPRAAIEDALEVRINEYRERAGEEPTRRAKRKLREQTRDELLPKAFVRSQRTSGFVIPSERIIAIDTLSDSRAEHFLDPAPPFRQRRIVRTGRRRPKKSESWASIERCSSSGSRIR